MLPILYTFTVDTEEYSRDLSPVYLWIRLKGYDIYIRVGSVSLGKGQKAFKTGPVNLKSILPMTSLKRIPTGVEHKNYRKP